MKLTSRFFAGVALVSAIIAMLVGGCTAQGDSIAQAEKSDKDAPGIRDTKAIAEEAYIYGFPMIAAYKAMYQFNIDPIVLCVPAVEQGRYYSVQLTNMYSFNRSATQVGSAFGNLLAEGNPAVDSPARVRNVEASARRAGEVSTAIPLGMR